jgi:hypothetical protein
MVSPQPILSYKYFQYKKNKLPKGIKCLFYLSWEDALWDLLLKKNIKKNSNILVPSFYCDDVEGNIKSHGYKVVYYITNSNLTTDKKSFQIAIKKYKPSVVIVFNPAGIKNNLFENTKWLSKITNKSVLIEDSVHRIIKPTEIKIIKRNHFVIDSLRKVVPLQGARIFGRSEDLNYKEPPIYQSAFYALGVNVLWLLMQVFLTLGMYKLAEKMMIIDYKLIGNSKLAARGLILNRFLSERLNISKIERSKVNQTDYYEKELNKILPIRLKIPLKDKKHLRGFPIILPIAKSQNILDYLRNKGLLLRFELNNSTWAKKQNIIFLPLGIHMTEKQQDQVCDLVKNAFVHTQA